MISAISEVAIGATLGEILRHMVDAVIYALMLFAPFACLLLPVLGIVALIVYLLRQRAKKRRAAPPADGPK